MGYRSQVAIAVSTENWKNAPMEVKQAVTDMGLTVESKTENTILTHDFIKWYDEYPEVVTITKWLASLSDDDNDNYGFIRLGEDDSDVETLGDPWDYGINYTRTITVD